jgi:hypothetical protein
VAETRNYNWEMYVKKHVENHNILDSMVGRGDFMGIAPKCSERKHFTICYKQPAKNNAEGKSPREEAVTWLCSSYGNAIYLQSMLLLSKSRPQKA